MSEMDELGPPSSKLSPEQRQTFLNWMSSKAPLIGKCPLCNAREWSLIEEIIELRPFHGGSMVVGGPTYPNVGVICNNCGNTQLVNAVVSGVLKSITSEPEGV